MDPFILWMTGTIVVLCVVTMIVIAYASIQRIRELHHETGIPTEPS